MRQKNRKSESKPITIDRIDSTSIDYGNDFWRANAKCNMLVVDIVQTSRSSLEKCVFTFFNIYIYIHFITFYSYIYIYLCVFLNMNRVCYVTEVAPSTRFRQLSDTWRNCSSFAASKGRSPRATMKHGCVILARESIVYRRGSSESGRKGIAHKQATEGSVWLLCWFIGMFPQPSWSCHYPNVGDCMGPYHKFLHSVPAISSSWSSCHLASSLSASCVNIANIYHMDTKLFSWANSSQPTHHTSSLAES